MLQSRSAFPLRASRSTRTSGSSRNRAWQAAAAISVGVGVGAVATVIVATMALTGISGASTPRATLTVAAERSYFNSQIPGLSWFRCVGGTVECGWNDPWYIVVAGNAGVEVSLGHIDSMSQALFNHDRTIQLRTVVHYTGVRPLLWLAELEHQGVIGKRFMTVGRESVEFWGETGDQGTWTVFVTF